MHRASAFENPTAPLGHHTFDSTHITMGVLTAGVEQGRWQVGGIGLSRRRARRTAVGPDGSRGARFVVGARLVPPERAWTFQVSHGFLNTPEASSLATYGGRRRRHHGWHNAPQDGRRHVAYGRNDKPVATSTRCWPKPRTLRRQRVYGRFEALQVETDVLRFGDHTFVGSSKRRA